jgi:transcriptional regulator with PAS, ATPase and Fis domain
MAMSEPQPKNPATDWPDEVGAGITVIDRDFTILYMNGKSAVSFAKWGEKGLIGQDVRRCHEERSVRIIEHILETGEPNIYTVEKQGVKKLIYQTPWYKNGQIMGVVEFSMEIPLEMPHYVRG